MAYDKAALIEQLGGLTVLELVDLVEGLKETWGVEAAGGRPDRPGGGREAGQPRPGARRRAGV